MIHPRLRSHFPPSRDFSHTLPSRFKRLVARSGVSDATELSVLATDILEDIARGQHTLPCTRSTALALADKHLIGHEILNLSGFELSRSAEKAGCPLPLPSPLHTAFAKAILSAAYLARTAAQGIVIDQNPYGVKPDGGWIITTAITYATHEQHLHDLYEIACSDSTAYLSVDGDFSEGAATECAPAPVLS